MKTLYKLVILSTLGFTITIVYVIYSNQTIVATTQSMKQIKTPFKSFIYATGVVEPENTNIPIGSPVTGVLTKLFVHTGQEIKIGDPLFSIDSRSIRYKIEFLKEKIKVSEANLTKILRKHQIKEELHKKAPEAISKQDYFISADDLALAKAQLALAESELKVLTMELKRYTVYSPINGEVLQCRLREGEYIDSGQIPSRAIIVGGNKLRLRVDINENDLLRFKANAQAVAFVRNHKNLRMLLHYQYTEPYILPKRSLTGASTERTDLRVLQVIYSFPKPKFPLYVGQQLDIFIQAPEKDSI